MSSRFVGGAVAVSLILFSSHAVSSEVQFGTGTMQLQGALLGLESDLSSPVTVYTLKEQHANVLSSKVFYNYQLSYYSGDPAKTEGGVSAGFAGGRLVLPETSYELSGVDAQLTLGYDLYNEGKHDYVGIGVSLGIAVPTIQNSGSAGQGLQPNVPLIFPPVAVPEGDTPVDIWASKTEMMGYKLGPSVVASKDLGHHLSLFGQASFAWQTMRVENKTLDTRFDVDGTYVSYGVGVRYQLLDMEADLGAFSLDPGLYFTLGVHYSRLVLDEFGLDLSGNNFDLGASKLDTSATTYHAGVGYSF